MLNERLSATVDNQSEQIKALTMENKDYLLKISDYKHGTIKLLEDLHKLKDELVHGALESVRRETKLQTMEKDLSVTTGGLCVVFSLILLMYKYGRNTSTATIKLTGYRVFVNYFFDVRVWTQSKYKRI